VPRRKLRYSEIHDRIILRGNFLLGVRQQLEAQPLFRAEILVRTHIIGADPDDLDVCPIEVGLPCRKRFPLHGATRGVVLGIEIHDEPVARVIAQLGDFAVLIRKGKIRKWTACLHHELVIFLSRRC
jgi:hypothetical protein